MSDAISEAARARHVAAFAEHGYTLVERALESALVVRAAVGGRLR